MKKFPGDIIILHMCTKNRNHMMYGSWDLEGGRQNFLSLWTVLCSCNMACNGFNYFHFGLFITLLLLWQPSKSKFRKSKKKKKENLEISSFYNSVPKIMIICYPVPEIWCVMDVIISHFWLFFALLPPIAWKMKTKKKIWKNNLKISSFYISVSKLWSHDVQFLRYGAWQM